MSNDLTIRPATSDEDCKTIMRLLIGMYDEVGRAPIDPNKGFIEIYSVVHEQAAFMVFDGENLVATCGLIQPEGGLWYSESTYITERWFYVRPEYRDAGEAVALLFEAARQLSDDTGLLVLLTVFNFKRSRPRSPLARVAEKFAYRPAGSILSIQPRESTDVR